MTRTNARVLLILSLTVVTTAIVVWGTGAVREGRADLEGEPVSVSQRSPSVPEASSPLPSTSLPGTPEIAPSTTVQQVTLSEPRRLVVPAIGVDAAVVPVGLEPDGSMEIPGVDEAGWYKFGPRPGEYDGSSVIAAHVDFNGAEGVFFDLRRLDVGAEVVIVDDRGVQHRYAVSERFQVGKRQLPSGELFRVDGPATLTLITCGGAFDRSNRSYEDNIVVRALPVP